MLSVPRGSRPPIHRPPSIRTACTKTFDTLDKLEHHNGHFYNWYETNTLVTMHPPYVSTVDSGNLLACLIALKHRLLDLADSDSELSAELDHTRGPCRHHGHQHELRLSLQRRSRTLLDRLQGRCPPAGSMRITMICWRPKPVLPASSPWPAAKCPGSWFRLGRLVTMSAGRIGLVSWGGTMFEY